MKGRMLTVCIVTVTFFMALIICPPGDAQVTTLKYSDSFPSSNEVGMLAQQWCNEVEKRTNGRVKVNYFPVGTLTPPAQTYDGVIEGITDIGGSFCSYTRGRFPLSEVIDLPLGYKTGYVGTKLVNEYLKRFNPKEFADVKVLYLHTSPPHMLFTKKPVNNLEELKGLKIRSTGTSAKVVQALGGAPVGMPMADAYDALAKGVVDGIVCPYEPMKGWKLAEVINSSTEYGSAYTNAAYVVMNKKKWDALPPETQKVIEAINAEYIEMQGKLWDKLNKEGKDLFVQKGKKVVMLSKSEDERWAKALSPILNEYVGAMKAKALPGDEALKFCVDYLKAQQK
jgi:TRAP-type transport system periplasmic protein